MVVDNMEQLRVLIEASRLELGGDPPTYEGLIVQLDRLAHNIESGSLDYEVLENTLSEIRDYFPLTFAVGTVGAATSKLQAAIIEIQNTGISFARLPAK